MSRIDARRAGVVGLGSSGEAAALALAAEGLEVWVAEEQTTATFEKRADRLRARGIGVELGGYSELLARSELLILSPGVPPHASVVLDAVAAGIPMWSEIELAYRLASCDLLAVTGTNGKTTTTALLAAMLHEGGVPSLAAGNIGLPLVQAVGDLHHGGAIAAEVSSFQLASIDTFRPRVAVILNVAPDHIDWHGSFDAYVDAKARIVENQKPEDVVVFNAGDEHARSIAERSEATRKTAFSSVDALPDGLWADDRLHWGDSAIAPVAAVGLPGPAGLEDALAAAGAALEYGVAPSAVERALRSFEPMHHRSEVVAQHAGVTYVDDSKATNPHAALAAVRGLDRVALIAGGRSKGIDLSVMARMVPPVVGVAALGEAAAEIERVFSGLVPVQRCAAMEEAVAVATRMIGSSGSVLLAPGCASLDMYESYAARGEHFARSVRDLIENPDDDGLGEDGLGEDRPEGNRENQDHDAGERRTGGGA